MTREEAVALLERYSNYEGLGIPNLAGCKEAMKVAAEALKEAYPELAESEDERIRRWLCDYFSSIDKAWIHKDITCIDILRWLEKQKEQMKEKFPPYVTGFKGHPDPAGTSDLEEAAEKYIQGSMCDLDDGPSTGLAKESFIAGAEWQKEQKPAEWSDTKELVFQDICNHLQEEGYSGWVLLLNALHNGEFQPKPEWSKEDSDILRDAICAADILAKDFKKDNPHVSKTLRVAKEWLESLPERFTLPIKQEWDEFDEDCLKRAIWYVENPAPSVVKDTNLALWLKSLPERKNLPPKQEWNKEDERIRKALVWHLKADVDFVSNGVTKAECIAYLEKQKEQKLIMANSPQLKEQKPAEWSEEDEDNLCRVIRVLEDNDSDWKELSNWLKSLRPVSKESLQPHWKPSEEQMDALLNTLRPDDPYYPVLKSLYEQLK